MVRPITIRERDICFLIDPLDVNIIPWDNGYFAEMEVTGFSEFWMDQFSEVLPVELLSFRVMKEGNDVSINWITTSIDGDGEV